MTEEQLISPVDHKEISLSGMSKIEMRDLHYTEEVKMAKMILSYKPFSKQRSQLLNRGYEFVENLKLRYERNDEGSFGASPLSVKIIKDVISYRQERNQTQQIVYEAGVGTGYAVKELSVIKGVKFYGCDITLLPSVKKIMQEDQTICIHERTLYEDLEKMPNESIDVFYADNVIEHLIPDEVPFIFRRLNKKMKKGGQLIWFIPNKYLGPQDVSKYYLPKGQKAAGFHFMEMGYGECIFLALKHGFKPKWIVKKSGNSLCVERDYLFIKNFKKVVQEQIIKQIRNPAIRLELLTMGIYTCYVFEK